MRHLSDITGDIIKNPTAYGGAALRRLLFFMGLPVNYDEPLVITRVRVISAIKEREKYSLPKKRG